VVIGDSTAAAIGNPPVQRATPQDTACGRSLDSYAADLASVNGWNVLNLACSGATIRDGLLGPQTLNGYTAPAQVELARTAADARVIIVSVGADDVHWAAMTEICASADACDDQVTTAYFNQQLASFTLDYYALLRQLAALPRHPTVLINEYYNPFGESVSCLSSYGLTQAKADALRGRLDQLNTVLREGAQASGFEAVTQHFDGHQLCSGQSFVQGPDANAPLHPTVTGELAIALADQQALSPRTATSPGSPAGSSPPGLAAP
jgi:lysophospholipase L1-like esterase